MAAPDRRSLPPVPTTTLRKNGAVTIPRAIREQLGLREGDRLVMAVQGGRLLMIPASTIPPDQAWFWTPGWQAKEREVEEDLAHGERGLVFGDGEAFLRFLADDAGLDFPPLPRP